MSEEKRESDLLCWLDFETTGLIASEESILEIAVIITDGNLKYRQIGPSVVIHADQSRLAAMDPFVQTMHTNNGLWQECLDSHKTVQDAEYEVLTWLKAIEEPGMVPLAGSTISFDRSFLAAYMPDLNSWFHYRNIDVSSFKEAWKRWLPQVAARIPKKQELHRSHADILDSINALGFFRDEVLDVHAHTRVPF